MSPMVSEVLSERGWQVIVEMLDQQGEKPGHFVSPINIFIALAMAMRGAGLRSSCWSEVVQYLNKVAEDESELWLLQELGGLLELLKQEVEGTSDVAIFANSVWTSTAAVVPEYVGEVAGSLKAVARQVNSVDPINQWCSAVTNNMISELVEAGNFSLVLASAMYLKLEWKHTFPAEEGIVGKFRTYMGRYLEVPMMMRHATDLTVFKAPDMFAAVRLDYKHEAFYALAVLPNEGVPLKQVTENACGISDSGLGQWCRVPSARIVLPPFSVSSDLNLADHLGNMGVTAMFDANEADFSRMTSSPVHVGRAVHKVVVNVNEWGTEAASGSALEFYEEDEVMRPISFIFDRPFLFSVYHARTNVPVLLGAVLEPPHYPEELSPEWLAANDTASEQ